MDWLYLIFMMLLYAIIPCIPAVLLRIKFPGASKIIALTASLVGVACLAIILFSNAEMLENEKLMLFVECAFASSVPALFCAAFCGEGKNILIAILPPLMYFLGSFARYGIAFGFSGIIDLVRYLNPEFVLYGGSQVDWNKVEYMIKIIIMSVIFLAWAVICIIISSLIYKIIIIYRKKNKIKNKKKRGRLV